MVEIPPEKIIGIYGSLMVQVKVRIWAVREQLAAISAINEKGDNPSTEDMARTIYALEFGYLQLRRICELVAVAVVAAHNEFAEFRSNKFVEEYNADALMRKMKRLSETAFPRHATVMPGYQPGSFQILYNVQDFLAPKDDISRIYRECGDKLHSGHLRFLLENTIKRYSAQFIVDSEATFENMLNEHTLQVPDGRVIEAKLHLESDEHVFCRWLSPNPPQQSASPNIPRPPFR